MRTSALRLAGQYQLTALTEPLPDPKQFSRRDGEPERLAARRKHADVQAEYNAMTCVALYMLLMTFAQKGIDRLRNYHEHMQMRDPDGELEMSEGEEREGVLGASAGERGLIARADSHRRRDRGSSTYSVYAGTAPEYESAAGIRALVPSAREEHNLPDGFADSARVFLQLCILTDMPLSCVLLQILSCSKYATEVPCTIASSRSALPAYFAGFCCAVYCYRNASQVLCPESRRVALLRMRTTPVSAAHRYSDRMQARRSPRIVTTSQEFRRSPIRTLI